MGSSVRLLLIGVVLLSPGYLARPAAAGTEPETLSAWSGDPAVEPAAVAPTEDSGAAPVAVSPVTGDATAALDVDLWVEFFTTPAPTVLAKPQPAPAVARAVAAVPAGPLKAGAVAGGYTVQQNDSVQRFLDQFQTGYRRAVVERWLTRSGRFLPMILEVFRQKGLPEELVFTAMIESGFDPVADRHGFVVATPTASTRPSGSGASSAPRTT